MQLAASHTQLQAEHTALQQERVRGCAHAVRNPQTACTQSWAASEGKNTTGRRDTLQAAPGHVGASRPVSRHQAAASLKHLGCTQGAGTTSDALSAAGCWESPHPFNCGYLHCLPRPHHGCLPQAAIERQYQGLCDSWREELEHKQSQFDAALARMTPPA